MLIFLYNPLFGKVSLEMEEIEYGDWSISPETIDFSKAELMRISDSVWKKIDTKHEGKVLYESCWNFWIRSGVKGDSRSNLFFRDYEKSDQNTVKLFSDIHIPTSYPKSEPDIWSRIANLWDWLGSHVQLNISEYGTLSSLPNSWPSILDYAKYYVTHGNLVWAACFSKAHLFASLLGRIVPITRRILLAEAHHTEAGAPPTASHVYIATYISKQWFYLDPATLPFKPFPNFGSRQSVGATSFVSVDYEHPYKTIMLPGSDFEYVPLLSN